MSLLGLSLAIGILIDDAIVVRENIVRHVEMGKDHFTASREGTDEIGLAVAATTFSIVAGVRAGGLHERLRRPVVQAVRAHHRGVGAGVAVRLLLARPDALGLLAGSRRSRRTSAQGPDRARARPLQPLVRPAGGALPAASSRWALDHRLAMVALAVGSFVGALALQVAFGGFGFAPDERPQRAHRRRGERRRARASSTRGAGRAGRAAVARAPGGRATPTPPSAARRWLGERRRRRRCTCGSSRRRERDVQPGRSSGMVLRRGADADRRRDGVSVFEAGGPGGGLQAASSSAARAGRAELARLADSVRRRACAQVPGAVDVGLSTHGQKPELAWRSTAGWPARSA